MAYAPLLSSASNHHLPQSPTRHNHHHHHRTFCGVAKWRLVLAVAVVMVFMQFAFFSSHYYAPALGSLGFAKLLYGAGEAELPHDTKSPAAKKRSDAVILSTNVTTSAITNTALASPAPPIGAVITKLPVPVLSVSSQLRGGQSTSSSSNITQAKRNEVTSPSSQKPVYNTAQPVYETGAIASSTDYKQLDLCPMTPPVLVGPIKVWFDSPSFEELEKLYPNLEPGGHGKPSTCRSRHKVAIIIPYRNREVQLRTFLHNFHSLLRKQQLDYTIFVVEQMAGQKFNRAKLMNIGFVEANKLYKWDCFIFHDVDLLPEDDRNLYTCPEQPRHMSVAVDKLNYRLPYLDIFGGITALRTEQFQAVNGFSNSFWGWGGEDDEMASRVKMAGFKISRYSKDIARYKMIKHTHETTNPVNECRFNLMYKVRSRHSQDGLSSLKYKRLKLEQRHLFTWILVDLFEEQSLKDLAAEHVCSMANKPG